MQAASVAGRNGRKARPTVTQEISSSVDRSNARQAQELGSFKTAPIGKVASN